MVKTYTVTQDS